MLLLSPWPNLHCEYRPYAIDIVTSSTKCETDGGWKSGYFAIIFSGKNDCGLWRGWLCCEFLLLLDVIWNGNKGGGRVIASLHPFHSSSYMPAYTNLWPQPFQCIQSFNKEVGCSSFKVLFGLQHYLRLIPVWMLERFQVYRVVDILVTVPATGSSV